MKVDVKSPWLAIPTVIVAAVLVTGSIIGWPAVIGSITGLFGAQATIVAESPLRGEVTAFLTEEKIRLTLDGTEATRVYWLLDERQVIPGNTQIEHSFPYDSSVAEGVTSRRRIDAFYRVGDTYRTTTKLIATNNVSWLASIAIGDSIIEILADPEVAGGWEIYDGSITTLTNGVFVDRFSIPVSDSSRGILSFASTALASELRLDSTWLSVRYTHPDSRGVLTMLRNITARDTATF